MTCSCSYNINEAAFAEIVYDAAVDAQAHVTVVEKRMQGRDHPVLLGVPETYYLKCFILESSRRRRVDAARAAREARRALARMARPAGDFDSSRYFRGPGDLGFYNVGTAAMRALARSIHARTRHDWSIDDAMAFADALIVGSASRGEVGRHRGRRALPPRLHAAAAAGVEALARRQPFRQLGDDRRDLRRR